MNIIEYQKPLNPHNSNRILPKIVPKSKGVSSKQNKTEPDCNVLRSTHDQVDQMLAYFSVKSKKLKDFLNEKGIKDSKSTQQFLQKHFFESLCIKTLLKSIMDKMYQQKRLGKGLKGLNRSLQAQIQSIIWKSIEGEFALFQIDREYKKTTKQLKVQLNDWSSNIENQLKKIEQDQVEQILNVY